MNSSKKIAKFRENMKDIRNHAKCIQYTFVIGTNVLIRDAECSTTLITECNIVCGVFRKAVCCSTTQPRHAKIYRAVLLSFAFYSLAKRHPQVANASLLGYKYINC